MINVIFLISCFLVFQISFYQAILNSPNKIYVGFLQPQGFGHVPGAVTIAMEYINNNTAMFPNHTIVPVWYRTDGVDGARVISSTYNISQSAGFSKLTIGPNTYSEWAQAQASIFDQVNVALVGTNKALSNKALYPTYARADFASYVQAPALVDLCLKMKWKRIAIFSDSVNYQEITEDFSKLAVSKGIEIVVSQSYQAPGTADFLKIVDRDVITFNLDLVKKTDARILLLFIFQRDVPLILQEMDKRGMTKAPYQIVGNNDWIRYNAFWRPSISVTFPGITPALMGKWLTGSISIQFPWNITSPDYKFVYRRWADLCKEDQIKGTNVMFGYCEGPLDLTTNLIDGIRAGMYAIDNYEKLKSNCPSNPSYSVNCGLLQTMTEGRLLFKLLLNVSFEGCSGDFRFTSTGDRPTWYNIISYYGNTENDRHIVGKWTPEKGLDIPDMNKIMWSNGQFGQDYIPLDKDIIIAEGDVMPVRLESLYIGIAIIFNIVGCWGCLILIEQLLLDRTKNSRAKTAYGESNKLSIFFSNLSASTLLAIGGIVSVNWLNISSILLHQFSPFGTLIWGFFVCLAVGIIGIFISFYILTEEYNNMVRTIKKSTQNSLISYLANIFKNSLQPLNLLATLIMFITQVSIYVIIFSNLQMNMRIVFTPKAEGGLIAASVIYAVLMALALRCYFYMDLHRSWSVILMSMAILVPNHIIIQTLEYQYHLSNIVSDVYDVLTIRIICIVCGVVFIIVLLALQFQRMRLSRNSMDLLLIKIKEQMNKQELQIDKLKIEKKDLEYETEAANLVAELISVTCTGDIISYELIAYVMAKLKKLQTKSGKIGGYTKLFDNSSSNENTSSGKSNTGSTPTFNPKSAKYIHVKSRRITNDRFTNENNEITIEQKQNQSDANSLNQMNAINQSDLESDINQANNVTLNLAHEIYNQLTTPAIDHKLRNVSLDDILKDPICHEIFKQSVIKAQCGENTSFLLYLKLYKGVEKMEVNKEKQQEILNDIGQSIVSQFIKPEKDQSNQEINISGDLRNSIIEVANKVANKTGNFTFNFFDAAEKEVMMLLNQNNFKFFTDTEQFNVCFHILNLFGKNNRDKAPVNRS